MGGKFGPQLNGNLIKMVVMGDGFWWHWVEGAQINSSVDIGDFLEVRDAILLGLTDANGFDLMWVKCNFIITSWYQIFFLISKKRILLEKKSKRNKKSSR